MEGGESVKPLIIEDYTTHMGYVGFSDRMSNSYSISKKTSKWMKKLFLCLLDLTILNSYILCKSCGGNMTHLKFREQLVRELILSHEENTGICGVQRGCSSSLETQMIWLEVKYSLHWPTKGKELHHMCQMRKWSKKESTSGKIVTVVCVLCHALSCGLKKPDYDVNWLYL
jgi:hypothetical protein